MGNVFALICSLLLAGSPYEGNPAFVVVGVDSSRDTTGGVALVFQDVREGMLGNSVGRFASHFSQRVFIQLPESEGEFYSAKQAFYVLDRYLRNRSIVALQLSISESSASNPYATGNLTLLHTGNASASAVVCRSCKGGEPMDDHSFQYSVALHDLLTPTPHGCQLGLDSSPRPRRGTTRPAASSDIADGSHALGLHPRSRMGQDTGGACEREFDKGRSGVQ